MCLLLEVLEPLRLLVTQALALQRSQRSRSAEEMLCGHGASDDERAREAFWQPRLERRAKPRNDGCATRAEVWLAARLAGDGWGACEAKAGKRQVGERERVEVLWT